MINALDSSSSLRDPTIADRAMLSLRESDPRHAAEVAKALALAKAASRNVPDRLFGVDQMEDAIGRVIASQAGDAAVREKAKAAGYRRANLRVATFRPGDFMSRVSVEEFERAVDAAINGDGGALTSHKRVQDGMWVAIGYHIVKGHDVASEPARKRAREGEEAEVPDKGVFVGTIPVATETLALWVEFIDIAGGANTVYSKDGSGTPVDTQQVQVQVQQQAPSGGGNDATVAALMAQMERMRIQMEEMAAKAKAAPERPRGRPGRKPKAAPGTDPQSE